MRSNVSASSHKTDGSVWHFEEEIDVLKAKLRTKSSALKSAEAETSAHRKESEKLRKDLRQMERQHRIEVSKLRSEIMAAEKQLSLRGSEYSAMKNNIAQSKRELSDAKDLCKQYQVRVRALEKAAETSVSVNKKPTVQSRSMKPAKTIATPNKSGVSLPEDKSTAGLRKQIAILKTELLKQQNGNKDIVREERVKNENKIHSLMLALETERAAFHKENLGLRKKIESLQETVSTMELALDDAVSGKNLAAQVQRSSPGQKEGKIKPSSEHKELVPAAWKANPSSTEQGHLNSANLAAAEPQLGYVPKSMQQRLDLDVSDSSSDSNSNQVSY